MLRSRPQFTRSTHGTPGTMTPILARKSVAFSYSGFPYTEARVIICGFQLEKHLMGPQTQANITVYFCMDHAFEPEVTEYWRGLKLSMLPW